MNLILGFLKAPLDWFRGLIGEKLREETKVKLMDEKNRRKLADEIICVLTEGESTGWETKPREELKNQAFNLANKVELNFNNPMLAYLLRHYTNWWSLYVTSKSGFQDGLGHYKKVRSELEQINSDLREEIKNFRVGKKSKHPEIKAKSHK